MSIELIDKKQKLERDISHLETVKNQTLLVVESLRRNVELAQIELDETLDKKGKGGEEAGKIEKMIKQLQGYISEHQATAQKALKLRESVQNEVATLKAEKEALEAEIEARKRSASGEIKTTINSLEKEVNKLREEKTAISNEISKASSDLSTIRSNANKIRSEISILETRKVSLEAETKETEDALRVIRIEHLTKQGELASFDSRKEIIIIETQKAEDTLKAVKEEISKFTKDRDKVLKELEERQGEIININTAKLQIAEEKRNLAMREDNLKRLFQEAGLPWTD